MNYYFILTIVLFIGLVRSAPPKPSENFKNSLVLVQPDQYILHWNYDKNDVTFEIQVKGAVWAGFGFSPNGGMANSDVIITFNDQAGNNHFSDRHISSSLMFPVVDKRQDWIQLYSSNRDGYLVSKFKRKIKICDPNEEDKDIAEGTPFAIFAWGNTLKDGDITYHNANRGTKSIPVLSSLNTGEIRLDSVEMEISDFRVNTTIIPGYHTEYFCQMYKIPNSWLKTKRHVLKYETLITPGNENLLHHWTLSQCGEKFESEYLKSNSIPEPGPCFIMHPSQPQTKWVDIVNYCSQMSFVWAVGSPLVQDFPVDIAYPVGGSDREFTYFYLEMHYDNPSMKAGIRDDSGVRMFTTTNYRPIEFGTFYVGNIQTWPSITIPSKSPAYRSDFYCNSDCLDDLTESSPSNEITVFSTLPHAHLKGREIYTSVIRNGQEVDFITNNKYFDFNYQYFNFLRNPVKIKKGDQLRTTCVFNTDNNPDFSYAGLATTLSFVWYYPRNRNFHYCLDGFLLDEITPLLSSLEKSGHLEVVGGISNLSFYQEPTLIDKKKVNLTPIFQDYINTHKRSQVCMTRKNLTITSGNTRIMYSPMSDPPCMSIASKHSVVGVSIVLLAILASIYHMM